MNNKLNHVFIEPFVLALQEVGGEIFLVGGCVRDCFLNKEPKDIDLIVRNIPVKDLEFILSKYGTVDLVGESFGVFKFKDLKGIEYDIALPRTDSKIPGAKGHKSILTQSDHTLSLEADLKRRDFTFNAMAFDKNDNLIDPFEGLKDLLYKSVRIVDKEVFIDDPLRMIRAIQFAARFDFELSYSTFNLIRNNINLIKEIPPERILMEFEKVFDKKGNISTFSDLLSITGLFYSYFEADFNLENSRRTKSLAEFLYHSIELQNTSKAEFFLKKLKIPRFIYDDLDSLEIFFTGTGNPLPIIFKAIQKSHILFSLNNVDKRMFRLFIDRELPWTVNDLALKGNDFISLGLSGKEIGEAQRKCLDALFNFKTKNTKEDLFKLF